LIKRPKVLVIDDIDDCLDEELIQNLEMNWKGKTRLIVTNKLPMIKTCQRVVVLEEGKIIEDG